MGSLCEYFTYRRLRSITSISAFAPNADIY